MSLIKTLQKAEVPCRLFLCNRSWTAYHIATARKSTDQGRPTMISWDASAWADFPWGLRKLYNQSPEDREEQKKVKHLQMHYKDQEFRQERYDKLGPDIAAATFIVHRKGKVKFTSYAKWTSSVPLQKREGFHLEGIDASGMMLLPVAIDNLVNLEHFKYLKLSNVTYLSDWHLAKLGRFRNTLEFLDISSNSNITDKGLASLYRLRNLKCLNITNCSGLKYPEVVSTYLMEAIPDITIIGLDSYPANNQSIFEKECQELRFLNIGEQLEESGEKQELEAETVAEASGKVTDVEMPKVDREPLKEAASG